MPFICLVVIDVGACFVFSFPSGVRNGIMNSIFSVGVILDTLRIKHVIS